MSETEEKPKEKKLLTVSVPQYKKQPDEGDALKGKYVNEDLAQRKGQWSLVPMEWDEEKEKNIDFMLRQLSVASNGMGALGEDFPITADTSNAIRTYESRYLWAKKFKETNRMRMYLERHIRLLFHEVFDRSVAGVIPKVVLAYKPIIRDITPGLEGSSDADAQTQIEAAKRN